MSLNDRIDLAIKALHIAIQELTKATEMQKIELDRLRANQKPELKLVDSKGEEE